MKSLDKGTVVATLVDVLTTKLGRARAVVDAYDENPRPTVSLDARTKGDPKVIVSTGKIVRVDAGQYRFERGAEHPMSVFLTFGASELMLPSNKEEMERIIAAYRKACEEDVGFCKSEVGP